MREDVFISTQNFQKFQGLVDDVLGTSLGVEIAVVLGAYGRGKTRAAQRIISMNGGTVYVYYEPRMSLAGLVREIAFALGGVRPRSSDACVEVIKEELSIRRRAVLVDEADQMSVSQLNQLRAFHDLHRAPLVLIGEDALWRKIAREGRVASRVRQVLRFEPITQADLVVFYRQAVDQAVTPAQAAQLLRAAKGDFRSVVVGAARAERIMRASGIKDITDDIVKAVCDGR